MATLSPDSDEAKRIDAALQDWRQGDLALEESWFVHVGDPGAPLTDAAAEAAADADLQALTSEVRGLIVVTQTCDIVRACVDRPYVEVAPLVQVSEDDLHQVKRGRRPAYATLPNLEPDRLVADLDRVITVEKSIVASWKRTPGYVDDAAGRAFAQALARKRVRFAFPDDFTSLVDKLQRRLVDKHDKDSVEGRGLRTLREIRVRAAPSWEAAEVEILFWFVRDEEEVMFQGRSWTDLLSSWLKLVPASGRFKAVEGQVVLLEDMTARDYVESDPRSGPPLDEREGVTLRCKAGHRADSQPSTLGCTDEPVAEIVPNTQPLNSERRTSGEHPAEQGVASSKLTARVSHQRPASAAIRRLRRGASTG